ncbi:MAG: hypothetical protein AAF942_06300, partial [Pseudomonadota bacterium]
NLLLVFQRFPALLQISIKPMPRRYSTAQCGAPGILSHRRRFVRNADAFALVRGTAAFGKSMRSFNLIFQRKESHRNKHSIQLRAESRSPFHLYYEFEFTHYDFTGNFAQ